MNVLLSLVAVLGLVLAAYVGAEKLNVQVLFGIVVPYVAIGMFLVGMVRRVLYWARSPVPFRVPTTCGQQKSLPWIKASNLESPHNLWGVMGRMALEILTFRSLFRNTRTQVKNGERLVFGPEKWLWLAALGFHYSFLVVFIRHFKFFAEPVPYLVSLVGELDGFFQVGLPALYLTDLLLVAALTWLFIRRLLNLQVRYISLASDYFPLFLLLGVALTGILMRYFIKVDVVAVKELATGLISLHPTLSGGKSLASIGSIFYIHLFLVSTLIAYFPFSKLVHLAGVFLSPTRNLANNNRMVRHENPWDLAVRNQVYPNWDHLHSYEQYEEEFREKFEASGLRMDKD